MKSYRNIHTTILLPFLLAFITGLLVLSTSASPGYASTGNASNNPYSTLTTTPNMIAAGGSPIPPNWTMAQEEAECAAELANPGWYRTLNPSTHYDSARTVLISCAQFPGSYTGPNDVYAYPSSEIYINPWNVATRDLDEMYLYGGSNGGADPYSPAYVSRVELGSLNEIWRTYLNNFNVTDSFTLSGAGNILADGSIGAVTTHQAYKLNATTGAIEAVLTLPTGDNPPTDSGFNGYSAFPGDGNLVFKSFNRPVGCTLNGYDAAAFKCPGAPGAASPSVLSVVDPKTWKVLDWIQGTENGAGRITTSEFGGKNYAYFAGVSNVFRYVWDGTNISLDETWGPVPYLKPGQGPAGAVMILNDWVILTTNGNPSNASMSVVAISQENASKIARIDPIPLEPGQQSQYPAHGSVDQENNRIYAMDFGLHKAFAVDIDSSTGNMSVAWVEPQWSRSYITLIGPSYDRVFVNTNISSPVTQNASELIPWADTANYVEQMQWRDADTGKLLAASDFFPPATFEGPVPVGYGGMIYDVLNIGNIIALQVLPTTSATSTANITSTTSTTAGQNSTSAAG
ncbi:MAG: hypothetical protein WBX01_09045 [Nitrososphaeraceae archaeon]